MPPKKKSSKKAEDDWEAEALGEATNGPDSTSSSAPTQQLPEDGDQTEEAGLGGGGGLLAALKKNKQSKKKKGKILALDDLDADETSDNTVANGTSAQSPSAAGNTFQAPEEGDPDDFFSPPNTKGKTTKGKPGKKETPAQTEHGEPGEDTGGLKSKKEKEKEKKEREKQRKKEQAAKKKPTAPAASTPKSESANARPSDEAKIDAPSTVDNSKGKPKKLPAHLAAIQKQQELLRQEREARAQADAEERKRIEEEERQAAEEEKRKEEVRQRKKEKERAKKEQLKKEGKLLTPAQREQQRRDEMKRQQMMAAGMQVAGMDDDVTERKRPVYDSKRKKGARKPDDKKSVDQEAQQEALQEQEAEQERLRLEHEAQSRLQEASNAPDTAAVTDNDDQEPESDELDDWEKAAEADEAMANDAPVAPERNSVSAPSHEAVDTIAERDKSGSQARGKIARANESVSEDEVSDDAPISTTTSKAAALKKAELASRRKQEHEEALAARSKDNLRSPICCILGHVDTGKTKLLDKVRQTNVQEGEAGGITQQIGATYFPVDALKSKTEVVNQDGKFEFKVPGLLVIDTPGHESFTNLRSRGSSLCNIAILVVDIMHGLEPQTLESMRLLRDRKTPFIVALNKIDRLYGWKKVDNNGFLDSISKQNKGVQGEFRDRLERTKLAFSEQGFNAELFSENKSMARNVSLVPTSAHTGEGVPDLLKLLVSLTQERMANQLMYLSEVECTVLEVKVIEGLGTTIDVVLSNGVLHEGDQIVLCGLEGAISTKIRALLTPAPLKELRLKSQYVHNQECKAALGVKITANNLDNAIAGSRLLVARNPEEVEDLEEEVMSDIENLLSRVTKTGRGVSVQASTLGSLEALLEFLKVSKIPVANISIGPVYKRDVMTAGIMLEKSPEYAVMLCFDVKVDKEAQTYADEHGIKIFTADIIYHLFDDFTKHMAQLAEQRKEENKHLAVFPCILQPIAVFMKKDPIVVGADVTEGNLRLQTPIAAIKINPITGVKEVVSLGRVTSIEREHKAIPNAKKGSPSVAVKIEGPNQPLYGRHLAEKDTLYSLISRQSIDTLKELYRSEVSNDEWLLIKKLKPMFDVA